MTVEPALMRANRINSDSSDWSYIGISLTVGQTTSWRRARGNPQLIHRLPQADGCKGPALRRSGRVHLRGPGQCLGVDVFPDVGQSAIPDRDGEDPVVHKRLVRGFDLSLCEADDEDAVSLRHEFPGFRGRFDRLGCRLKQIRQPGVTAARAGQRPVLARNDPLDVFGGQYQQSLPVAATDRGEEVLHGLDILLNAHGYFSISHESGRSRSDLRIVALPVGTSCSSVELDQVLKDQMTPAISACLDEQPAFR